MKTAPRPAPAPRAWVTQGEAADEIRASKRTIRRWVKDGREAEDPALCIREKKIDAMLLVHIEDVKRVKRIKDQYRDAPTFGRE